MKEQLGNSLHQKSNGNGQRLIQFASSHNAIVSSTTFQHKDIHNMTWRSPDGKVHNQIDHVVVNRRYARCITDVRSQRGADVGTDHYLVRIKFRCRIQLKKRATVLRNVSFDVDKLRDGKIPRRSMKSNKE